MTAAALCLGAMLAAGPGARANEEKAPVDPLDRYNVVWQSPSKDSSGSMPLGNGDVGLNVWVQEDGDLRFYISKTDAWSGICRLLKLGRLRIKLSPNPFAQGLPFRQTLKLRRGQIEIVAGAEGRQVTLDVWVDANRPVIHVDAESPVPFEVQVSLEVWRTKPRQLQGSEVDSAYGLDDGAPIPAIVEPDTILDTKDHRITWHHRNESSIWPKVLEHQALAEVAKQRDDPLLRRTFGGVIEGEGLVEVDSTTLESAQPRNRHEIAVHVLTRQTATLDQWLAAIEQQIAQAKTTNLGQAKAEHQRWWEEFWNRSWIRVTTSPGAIPSGHEAPGDPTFIVSQGYVLQRFISACGGRGAFPIKFNGSIFTVDHAGGKEFDADYRQWGGPYWFQNTRLAYWPMMASGDFDLMRPLFGMYLDALPLAEQRVRTYYDHAGAFFPETMYFWGAPTGTNYGWDRAGVPDGFIRNSYIRYYWSGALELTTMMLDYHAHTQDRQFLQSTLLPLAQSIIEFYDRHYPRDGQGKILLKPAASLETWHVAVNPLPEIVGLGFVLDKMLALPDDAVSKARRADWRRLLGELPSLPSGKVDGRTCLLPASEYSHRANSENPELYAVFPYRRFGLGKPDLEVGRLTFQRRMVKGTGGWRQDAIQAAYLGLTDVAKEYTVKNFSSGDPGSRFPAFWGPNFDWIPDQDHGSVAVIALQTMLLQTEDRKILLLPAWPKHWNVEFKLHAPYNTTVEGVYRDGKLLRLKVTPSARTSDVCSAWLPAGESHLWLRCVSFPKQVVQRAVAMTGFGSFHPGGCQVTMADGSVHFQERKHGHQRLPRPGRPLPTAFK